MPYLKEKCPVCMAKQTKKQVKNQKPEVVPCLVDNPSASNEYRIINCSSMKCKYKRVYKVKEEKHGAETD